jgi:DNA-binding response OmpR family regulator
MKILIVEDEKHLARSIQRYLEREKYLCEIAYDITQGREMVNQFNYDCVLLDLNLPEGSGLSLLRDLKREKKQDGVIIISARNSVDDKVMSLKLGADDYLAKPFHLAELGARVEAVIRRRFLNGDNMIRFQNLQIDTVSRAAFVDETDAGLTRTEYELLLFLFMNRGRVVSKSAIAEHLGGQAAIHLDNFDIIYAHVKNLKKKLSSVGNCIKTVYAAGYKFCE